MVYLDYQVTFKLRENHFTLVVLLSTTVNKDPIPPLLHVCSSGPHNTGISFSWPLSKDNHSDPQKWWSLFSRNHNQLFFANKPKDAMMCGIHSTKVICATESFGRTFLDWCWNCESDDVWGIGLTLKSTGPCQKLFPSCLQSAFKETVL